MQKFPTIRKGNEKCRSAFRESTIWKNMKTISANFFYFYFVGKYPSFFSLLPKLIQKRNCIRKIFSIFFFLVDFNYGLKKKFIKNWDRNRTKVANYRLKCKQTSQQRRKKIKRKEKKRQRKRWKIRKLYCDNCRK